MSSALLKISIGGKQPRIENFGRLGDGILSDITKVDGAMVSLRKMRQCMTTSANGKQTKSLHLWLFSVASEAG